MTDFPNFELLIEEDGLVYYCADYFDRAHSARYLKDLKEGVPWTQAEVLVYGRHLKTPRLTAWYGDPGVQYRYSGRVEVARGWSPAILKIKASLEEQIPHPMNSVLLNYYRDGRDSMGWHSDDEPELGTNPLIVSVSFGGKRRFHLHHKRDKAKKRWIDLSDGSVLIMAGPLQHHWRHGIYKVSRPLGPRINLTFRHIRI